MYTFYVLLSSAGSGFAVISKKKGSSSKEPSPPLEVTGDFSSRDAIIDLEKRTMGKDWRDVLEPEFKKPYFTQVRISPNVRVLVRD
jgi:hypothetical protein